MKFSKYLLLVSMTGLFMLLALLPVLAGETKLIASDGDVDDLFGEAVSRSGDLLLVGSPNDDDQGTDAGAAYLYEKFAGVWQETIKLTVTDGTNEDYFGSSVALSGSIAVVAAPADDDNGSESGSVYIFEQGSGWSQVAKLVGSDVGQDDGFGESVAISGGVVVVGAPKADGGATNSGAAYVFEKVDDVWTETAKVYSVTSDESDFFGYTLDVDSDTIIVGAPYSTEIVSNAGAAYIFEKVDSTWTEVQKITDPTGSFQYRIGTSLALSGSVAVVGLPFDGGKGANFGSILVVERDATTWNVTARVYAEDAFSNSYFGASVDVSNDILLIGAPGGGDGGDVLGSGYAFEKIDDIWTQSAKILHQEGFAYDQYGSRLSLDGNLAAISAYSLDGNASQSGVVYLYSSIFFYPLTYTAGANGTLSGETDQVVDRGDGGTPVTAVPDTGYYFMKWSDDSTDNPRTDNDVQNEIDVTAVFSNDKHSLAYTPGINGTITGDLAQQVTHGEDGTPVTAVPDAPYSFLNWSDGLTDNPRTDTNVITDISVTAIFSVDQYTLTYIAGENGSISGISPQTVDSGSNGTAVIAIPDSSYHFVDWSDGSIDNPRTDLNVTSDLTVTANFAIDQYTLSYTAGEYGSLTGNLAQTVDSGSDGSAVTAVPVSGYYFVKWNDDSVENPRVDTNVAHEVDVIAFFAEIDGEFEGGVQKTVPADYARGDHFGSSVSLSGDTALIGAYMSDDMGADSGSSYIYENIDGVWIFSKKLTAPDGTDDDHFGKCVSLSGETALIASPFDDDIGSNSGSVYFFEKSGGWTTVQKVIADDTAAGDMFGYSVSVNGDLAAVGAPYHDNVGNNSGAVYLFEKINGIWTQVGKLTASDGDSSDEFGSCVSISGDLVVVGSPNDDETKSSSGSSYIFEKVDSVWTEVFKIDDFAHSQDHKHLGHSVCASGNLVVVGVPYDNDLMENSGSIYIYEKINNSWVHTEKILPIDGGLDDNFGGAISINNNSILVGSPGNEINGEFSGSCYSYEKVDGAWVGVVKLTPSDGISGDSYGFSVSMDRNKGVVSSPLHDQQSGDNSGAVYFYSSVLQYQLVYLADDHGTISGETPQIVGLGKDGSPVLAVPDQGYHFVDWSDGSTENPRTDRNITQALEVTASFAINEYTLQYDEGENGSISGETTQTVIHGEDGSTVSAIPDVNHHFVDWSDGSTENPRTDLNVTADITVTANFSIDQYTLTYSAEATGSIDGTTPQTIDHGSDGTAVTAVPGNGYHFVDWSDGSTDNPRTDLNVTSDLTVTARFEINQYTLIYTAGENGTLTGSTSQTIDYGGDGSAVTAVPGANYRFVNWSDGSTENPRTDVNVTSDLSVTANFALGQYTLSYTAGENGSLTGDTSQTVDHGSDGSTVTAVPNTDYRFAGWSDGSSANPRTDLGVTNDITVTANFELDQYTLTYIAGENGSVTGTTIQTVPTGSDGTAVTAVPDTGYHFVDWSDGSTDNPRTDFNVTADLSVTANFELDQYTLTYLAGANGSISGTTPQTVDSGSDGSAVTAEPDSGYHFVDWSDESTENPRTDLNITSDITVTANFSINQYTLTYTAGENGSINGTSPQTINHGSDGSSITAEPDTGYIFIKWDDGSVANPRLDGNVTRDVTVKAIFGTEQTVPSSIWIVR